MKEDDFARMEGTLWKWTNYFSGWQPRWFLLEDGILSYYLSQDDINNGCKGSIKMSVCDVTVHSTDLTRLDLTIPGEAHFYVKATNAQERQQWLVALGSCKACLSNGQPQQKPDELPEEQLKVKRSELRLYCDLLMQQVHSVKASVDDPASPDIQKLSESSSLLSATCDTFISTLDACMTLSAPAPITPTSPARRQTSSSSLKSVPWGPSPTVSRSTSQERPDVGPDLTQKPRSYDVTVAAGML